MTQEQARVIAQAIKDTEREIALLMEQNKFRREAIAKVPRG